MLDGWCCQPVPFRIIRGPMFYPITDMCGPMSHYTLLIHSQSRSLLLSWTPTRCQDGTSRVHEGSTPSLPSWLTHCPECEHCREWEHWTVVISLLPSILSHWVSCSCSFCVQMACRETQYTTWRWLRCSQQDVEQQWSIARDDSSHLWQPWEPNSTSQVHRDCQWYRSTKDNIHHKYGCHFGSWLAEFLRRLYTRVQCVWLHLPSSTEGLDFNNHSWHRTDEWNSVPSMLSSTFQRTT